MEEWKQQHPLKNFAKIYVRHISVLGKVASDPQVRNVKIQDTFQRRKDLIGFVGEF